MKRLAVFLDGTWNKPDDNTNVWRLRSMMARTDESGNAQLAYYDTGVGTRWYDRFRGGLTGRGLSRNIREAYQWLVEHYEDEDEIYIFGFSRGAFTARSLAGMISRCGLLKPGAPMPVKQVFERYKRAEAKPIYRLPRGRPASDGLPLEDRWVAEYSRRVRIRFIGVWDTVGALGLNLIPRPHEARGEYDSHVVRLSNSFDHAYQAIALDEHRKSYPVSRWYRFIPEAAPRKSHAVPPEVEQRWFIGSHTNVGGGYRNDPLAHVPLAWLQSKANSVGLHFRTLQSLSGREHESSPVDSYRAFLKGLYRIAKLGRRSFREVGPETLAVERGWIVPHFETIDKSVFERWRFDDRYRPSNLQIWAERAGIDPATIMTTQPAHFEKE